MLILPSGNILTGGLVVFRARLKLDVRAVLLRIIRETYVSVPLAIA